MRIKPWVRPDSEKVILAIVGGGRCYTDAYRAFLISNDKLVDEEERMKKRWQRAFRNLVRSGKVGTMQKDGERYIIRV